MQYSTDLFIDIVILISIFVGVFVINYFMHKENDRNSCYGMTDKEVSILRHHLYVARKHYYISIMKQDNPRCILVCCTKYQAIKGLTKDLLQKEPLGLTAMLSDIDKEAKRDAKIEMYNDQHRIL